MGCYLQRSLSAQVNGGPDAKTGRGKQPISAVRVSGVSLVMYCLMLMLYPF